jgi:transcriptional regulator with XRE-family HTH domain
LQIEEYVAGNINDLCKKRHVSKYRLAQLTGIAQSSLERIIANESTPSLQTLEKICSALDVTLSQFFQDEKENHLTDKQNEVMEIWNDLSADEQAVVLAMLRGLKK